MARRAYKHGGITVSVPQGEFAEAIRWIYDDGSKVVTAEAASVVQAARAAAPYRHGDLRSGIVASDFEKDPGGKRIVQVAMDPKMNDTFVRKTKETKRHPDGKRYYYPASQEYGFRTRHPGRRAPGKYFMKTTAVGAIGQFQAAVEQSLEKALRKEANSE